MEPNLGSEEMPVGFGLLSGGNTIVPEAIAEMRTPFSACGWRDHCQRLQCLMDRIFIKKGMGSYIEKLS